MRGTDLGERERPLRPWRMSQAIGRWARVVDGERTMGLGGWWTGRRIEDVRAMGLGWGGRGGGVNLVFDGMLLLLVKPLWLEEDCRRRRRREHMLWQ